MKKVATLVAGGLALCNYAHAQSSVTLYGIFDTGVEYVTHANSNGDSLVRTTNLTGTTPSRFGIKGVEDLGGSYRALFVLENGFLPTTGATSYGNRLFGRAAYVGIGAPWGTVTLGRMLTMTPLSLVNADVLGTNSQGIAVMDAYIPNARSDNSIGYLGVFGGLTIGATYSLGRDTSAAGGPSGTNCPGQLPDDIRACRQYTGMVKYDSQHFGTAAAYDRMYGGPGAANGLTRSSFTDTRTTVDGYFLLSALKIGAGMIHRETETLVTTVSNLFFLGAEYRFTPSVILDAEVFHLNVASSPNDSTLFVSRLIYALSERTMVYTSVAFMKNRGMAALPVSAGATVGAGMDQTGVMVGIRQDF